MKSQNHQFTKFISLLKFPGLQYLARCRFALGEPGSVVSAPARLWRVSFTRRVAARKKANKQNISTQIRENHRNSVHDETIFRRVGTEGESWYIVCTANNYEMFFNLLLARINTFFNSFGSSTSWAA